MVLTLEHSIYGENAVQSILLCSRVKHLDHAEPIIGRWNVCTNKLTDAEWIELIDNCTWTWTVQNGVNGRLVTGPNGNSIFLPATGFRYYADLHDADSYGYYWSSSLISESPYDAWSVNFYSDHIYKWETTYRYYGQSVRPVLE